MIAQCTRDWGNWPRSFKDKQALSSGNKHGKTVKFENATEEENIIKSHDAPMQIKKKGKGHNNKSKSNQINADPSEDERNYRLDRLNLVKTTQESGSNSKWLLT